MYERIVVIVRLVVVVIVADLLIKFNVANVIDSKRYVAKEYLAMLCRRL